MITIKRYANRKLYNTVAKKYVKLEEIAELVQDGEDIRVLDHATGEDLTAITMAQIMLDHEKKGRGLLPTGMLTRLLQAGEGTLSMLRRSIYFPSDISQRVDEEIKRRIQVLIDDGELSEKEGMRWIDLLLSRSQPIETPATLSEDEMARLLKEHGVPERNDFQKLLQQIDALTHEIERFSGDST
jgi:polyhydroxyalkanoate synthesis repressor PhaR